MGKNANEKARERREQRREEISLLRTIPYSDHQRYLHSISMAYICKCRERGECGCNEETQVVGAGDDSGGDGGQPGDRVRDVEAAGGAGGEGGADVTGQQRGERGGEGAAGRRAGRGVPPAGRVGPSLPLPLLPLAPPIPRRLGYTRQQRRRQLQRRQRKLGGARQDRGGHQLLRRQEHDPSHDPPHEALLRRGPHRQCQLQARPPQWKAKQAWRRRDEGAIRGGGVSVGGIDRQDGDEVRPTSRGWELGVGWMATDVHGLFSVENGSECFHSAHGSLALRQTRRPEDIHKLLLPRLGQDRHDRLRRKHTRRRGGRHRSLACLTSRPSHYRQVLRRKTRSQLLNHVSTFRTLNANNSMFHIQVLPL